MSTTTPPCRLLREDSQVRRQVIIKDLKAGYLVEVGEEGGGRRLTATPE
jgi:hypothetical protein